MTFQPQPRTHIVNKCRAAAMTVWGHKDARDFEARTGRRANYCGNCHHYHVEF